MPIDTGVLSPQGASVATLLAVRMTSLIWIAPVFSSKTLTAGAKTGLSVLLVVLLWPVAMHLSGAAAPLVTAGTVLSELLIGLTLGLAGAIFIAAAEAAGDMLAVQMGLSGANVLDPMSRTQMPVLGQFMGLFVTSLVLAVGGHVVILQTMGASIEVLPLGSPVDAEAGILEVVGLGSTLLWLGLRFAAPVIAAITVGNAALGILARTVPQLNLLTVAFPVQIGIGLFMLWVSLPMVAAAFTDWPSVYQGLAGDLLEALRPEGRP